MFHFLLSNNLIQNDPGIIVGPIAHAMGWIIDLVFNQIYLLTRQNSLGFSIIILTIVVRFLMLPLAIKSQKSMMAMQKLSPEIELIRKKYGDTKDPELTQRMNAEIQALYAKHKANPLSGCLPLFIQLPIFFALTYLMNQSFLYIAKLGTVYNELAEQIMSVPQYWTVMNDIIYPHVPSKMVIDISIVKDMVKALNKLDGTDWQNVFTGLANLASPQLLDGIMQSFTQKQEIEIFFGMSLLERAGYMFPGVLIPVLSTATMFLSSWLSQKATPQVSKDKNAAMTQKMMMYAMPLVFGFFTINYPAGVGVYWITSSFFQLVQQLFLNRKFRATDSDKKEEPKK